MGIFKPNLENPYPEPGWQTITGFEYVDPLQLFRSAEALKFQSGEDADYVISHEYRVRFRLDEQVREITVPAGMLTDLTSVPRVARWLIGRVGRHLEAAIVHDFLYIGWQDLPGREPLEEDRRFADELMRVAMVAANVNSAMRFIIFWAIRIFGGWAYRSRNRHRYWLPDNATAGDGAV